MSQSPKRKSEELGENTTESVKKARIELSLDASKVAEEETLAVLENAPDTYIDHKAAIAYWSSTEPTVNGVLGGFPQVSRADLQGSANFLVKLRKRSKHFPPHVTLKQAVDCGAGIGRVTTGFLNRVAETVDIVEPVTTLTDRIKKENVGEIYNVGLQEWYPDRDGLGPYDLIWNQWCVGQLTDSQFVEYLKRCMKVLSEGGWVVVKENLSNHHLNEDVFDTTDSSVTRTDEKFRALFAEAGLKVVSTELQKGMPEGLYPVRSYALQPK